MMSSSVISVLLWAAALGSGLMAGVYFAFSAFIMNAFSNLETAQSIAAMNSINKTILRSWFMPLFFGSTIISLLLVMVAFIFWGQAGSGLSLAAGIIYFTGMFMCTVLFNVPLNNRLASSNKYSFDAEQAWTQYLVYWTRWNHVRTVASGICCALSIWTISLH